MKILYHIPSLHSIYAQRTIYNGFKNAFRALGHEFRPLTADDNAVDVFEKFRPNLFITASNFWHRKYIDYAELKRFRNEGMFTLAKVDFWKSPFSAMRINEAASLSNDRVALDLMQKDLLGDAYFHVVEQGDERMDGFAQGAGRGFHTIPLAADSTMHEPFIEPRFIADVSYIGTNLPDKRLFFKQNVMPLGRNYQLRLYGQDWNIASRALGWVQRAGQYFNLPIVRSIRKPTLRLDDEGLIYKSSAISINVHEKYQRQFGGDCNERTFKIPFFGGFEVVDNVACIRKYFRPGVEMIIGENDSDWVEKIHFYLKNPAERLKIVNAGRARVLAEHTYIHRAQQMIDISLGNLLR